MKIPMTVITRFAPSPTGLLHIGNVRTALICYLFAKSHAGKFMLRLDDTDTERSTEAYAQGIQRELTWLDLKWDTLARQSERLARYGEVIDSLKTQGLLYPCYETADEIEMKRKIQLSRGLPPIYDREALSLTDAQKSTFESEGRTPHWRFKLDHDKSITWNDLIKGEQHFEAKHLSDPVLIRENGSPTYMLPSAIDDMDFAISHVVRGEDHISNTAIQIQLFEAIGNHIPEFAHHSLIRGKEGKISKRKGGFDIEALRDSGIEPMTIISFLARLGTSEPIVIQQDMQEVIERFDISTLSKGSAIYDPQELERLNSKLIHQLPYHAVKEREELSGVDEAFWLAVQPNLNTIADILDWRRICKEPLSPEHDNADDAEFTQTASTLLPQEPWDETTWDIWIAAVKESSDRKGKKLFMPIRKALTAMEHGPELKYILPLIGREKVIKRLCGETA